MKKELHPSVSAVGSHLDEKMDENPASPKQHGIRLGNEDRKPAKARKSKPTDADARTEEMMHLAQ